jgi:hypothetical protein
MSPFLRGSSFIEAIGFVEITISVLYVRKITAENTVRLWYSLFLQK